jgi:hypothetical protein
VTDNDDVFFSWQARYNAIRGLGRLRDPEVLPLLRRIAQGTTPIAFGYGADEEDGAHVNQHAAANAIFDLTGVWPEYYGSSEFRTPLITLETTELSIPGEIPAETQGGSWTETGGVIRGASQGTGRLWMPWLLPAQYTLFVRIEAKAGTTVGISYGHLKDFVTWEPVRQDLVIDMVIWVSETDFFASAGIGGVDENGELLVDFDPRRVLIRTRRDLDRRVALTVSGGRADFSDIELHRGEVVYR